MIFNKLFLIINQFIKCCIFFIAFLNLKLIPAQTKYFFFEYLQDSLKTRTVNCATPSNLQAFSLNNSLVTDYVGNTRISVLTGLLTAKKDTTLALHSLANGAGNFTIDVELPLALKRVHYTVKRDFIGISFNPRASTIISSTQTFETSMVSYDLGINIGGRLTGDLGTISVRYILRGAICAGNQQFVRRAFGFAEKEFAYTSIQLRLRTGTNVLSFTAPIFIYSIEDKLISKLPVYAGYSLLF